MFAAVFKDSEASKKAWLKRTRAIHFGGKEKGWVGEDGKPIPKEVKDAMSRSKTPIPPGWTNVQVNLDPNHPLVATGTDAKGRTQRLYSKEHAGEAAVAKFARVAQLEKHIPKVLAQSASDMMNKKHPEKLRDTAATVNLMVKTGFRPGSTKDTGGDTQAYGASTLEKRHIKVNGDKVTFSFDGKHGVSQKKTLQDAELATYLDGKLKTLKPSEKVFQASGATAGAYLKQVTGGDFKVKDIRTWNGTALARHLLKSEKAPTNEKELKALQKKVSTMVSEHLGNTPAMALNSYINPMVWPQPGESMAPVKRAKK